MALDDEAVEAQVHGLLRERGDEFASAADVRRVADERQLRVAAAQLNGYLPHGQVAIDFLVVAGEAAVNGTQASDAGGIQSLQGAHPEFQVGIDGVLHEHGHVDSPQRIGQRLHGKRIGRRAGTHPENVDAVFQGQLHVSGCGHFGSHEHARFLFHALHPGQCLLAVAFKAAGLGAGLPHAGAEVVAAQFFQLAGCRDDLLFAFGRARTGNHERAFLVGR